MADNHVPAGPTKFFFDCPLCGKPLDVRLSKKGKPYVTCGDCSLQLFVRGARGIERFDTLAHTEEGRAKAAVVPRPVPESKLPRGRPRKNPEVAERAERLVLQPPFSLLLRRAQ